VPELALRDDVPEVLPVPLLEVDAALRDPPLPPLALLLDVFELVCFEDLLVAAIGPPFQD